MAGQAGFEYIKVSRADDDVVIVAGAVPQMPVQPVRDAAQVRPVVDGVTPADATYQGTTLEDIRGSRMPTAQKAVIALAVAAVVAFAIWYVAVML